MKKEVLIIIVLAFEKKKNPVINQNTQKVKPMFLLRIKNYTNTFTNILIEVQKT